MFDSSQGASRSCLGATRWINSCSNHLAPWIARAVCQSEADLRPRGLLVGLWVTAVRSKQIPRFPLAPLGAGVRDDTPILSSRGRSLAEGSACWSPLAGDRARSKRIPHFPSHSLRPGTRDDTPNLSSRGRALAEGSACGLLLAGDRARSKQIPRFPSQSLRPAARDDTPILSSRGQALAEGPACGSLLAGDTARAKQIHRFPSPPLGVGVRDDTLAQSVIPRPIFGRGICLSAGIDVNTDGDQGRL